MAEENLYSYAKELANAGCAVFPVKSYDKTPIIPRWQKMATTDQAIIKAWWQKYPNANIGIATGQISGGLYVIDMDKHSEDANGIEACDLWQRAHGMFPKSWMSKTGTDGVHYFFRDTEPHSNMAGIVPGVDFRGDGGYVVAPPSIHPNGNRYSWFKAFSPDVQDVAAVNDTLRAFINQRTSKVSMQFTAPEKIPQGERNDTLFRFACMMQGKGASDQAVYAATKAEMLSKCSVPLTEDELRNLVNHVLSRYEKGKPVFFHSNGEVLQGQREPIFATTQEGNIKRTLNNIREAIEYDAELYDHIKYNDLTNNMFVFGELPWEKKDTYRTWRNSDDANLICYLEKKYGFSSTEKIMNALTIVGNQHKFNPIVDELENIHKQYGESTGSIRKLLPEYMGAEDNEYNYEVMKVYMLGAISRIYHPGCKFDYSLILYGEQGFGKSEFLRHLAICSEWFNDNFNTFDGDKAIEKLSGMWIVEMAELKALKSAKDAESFKSFLTSRVDTYRAPYSRRSEQRPRMCVFAGTTNNKNVFVDKTGNRRFLPVETRKGMQTKDLFGNQEQVMEDFRKAWAEAMDLFIKANNEPILKLPDNIICQAEIMQEEFSEEDYRVGMIQSYLDTTTLDKVCVPMLIVNALEESVEHTTKLQRKEIMDILDNEIEGWSRVKNKDKGRLRFSKYGNQIAFTRD